MQNNDHVHRWRYWRIKNYKITPWDIAWLKHHAAELGLL